MNFLELLPTGSKERGVLGVGSIPVAILPSCQDKKTAALQLQRQGHFNVILRSNGQNNIETWRRQYESHNTPLGHYTNQGP